MENNQQQILSEIKTLMASVRNQLEELDAKLALWQQLADPQEADTPIELDFDIDMVNGISTIIPVVDEPDADEPDADEPDADEPVVEVPVVDEPVAEELVVNEPAVDIPVIDIPEADAPVVEMPDVKEETIEPEIETVLEPEAIVPELIEIEEVVESVEEAEESVEDDLPFFDVPEEIFQPEPVAPAVQKSVEKTAVIDVMTEKCQWKTAMPGSPVKDVRGAIALMDRVLFINNLFKTDAMAFQETLNQINQMKTLDQAVEYLVAEHPEWDFNSPIVYSFMMAVRRKVN